MNELLPRIQTLEAAINGSSPDLTAEKRAGLLQGLGSVKELIRKGLGDSASIEGTLRRLESEVLNLQYQKSAEVFVLLLLVRNTQSLPHAGALNTSLTELLERVPRTGGIGPKESTFLGNLISFSFDIRDGNSHSAVVCLRLALYLASAAGDLNVSAALFRTVHGAQVPIVTYIDLLRSYREPSLILSPDFEFCLPTWCRGSDPFYVAQTINRFQPIPGGSLSGESIDNPGLKKFQLTGRHNSKGDAYYLASATLLSEDREVFVVSEPSASLQVGFLRQGATYDPSLVDQIADAEEVHILGFTNENLSVALEAALKRRIGTPLRNLRVVFASDQIVRLIPAIDGLAVPHRLRRATGLKIIQHLRNSVGKNLAEEFEIRESVYPLPFVGVRTRAPNGEWRTRIGLCIPNHRNLNRPYINVPPGQFGSAIGEAFDYFIEKSSTIPNRVIVGTIQKTEPGTEVFCPTGLQDKALLVELPPEQVEANVLIIVYRKFQKKENTLLLQKRTKFNADDSIDKHSNLSARITESDCYKTAEGTLGADPHIADKDDAFDMVLEAIEIEEGGALPDWVFLNAAVRECYAGLGILQEPSAFCDHGARSLHHKRRNTQRFFKILSLGLEPNTFDDIAKNRPHANLVQEIGRAHV